MKITIKGLKHLNTPFVEASYMEREIGDIIAYGISSELHLSNAVTDDSCNEALYVDNLVRAMLVSDKNYGVYFCGKLCLSSHSADLQPELENLDGVYHIFINIEQD